jgi:hypothetical protein
MSISDRAPLTEVIEHARLLTAALSHLPAAVPTPTHVSIYTYAGADHVEIRWLLFGEDTAHDLEAQKSIAADVVRILGGNWEKSPGELFGFSQVRGAVHYDVMVHREAVCRRVVTGTEEIVSLVPAPDAPMVESVETIETVEWVCEPLLAKAGDPR